MCPSATGTSKQSQTNQTGYKQGSRVHITLTHQSIVDYSETTDQRPSDLLESNPRSLSLAAPHQRHPKPIHTRFRRLHHVFSSFLRITSTSHSIPNRMVPDPNHPMLLLNVDVPPWICTPSNLSIISLTALLRVPFVWIHCDCHLLHNHRV